jgi:hypothetical protein
MCARDVRLNQDVTGSESGKRTQTEIGEDNKGVKDVSFEFERHWITGADVTKMLTA